jgi:hypothetical protein
LDIPITVAGAAWSIVVGALLGLAMLQAVDRSALWLVRRC